MEEMELDGMRQQMATLRKKLEQQQIVNDRIMRKSMKRRASVITRRHVWLSVVGLLMVPYGYWAFVQLLGLSHLFWVGTSLMMVFCVAATLYIGRCLRRPGLMEGDLVEVRRQLALAKRQENQWFVIGIPMVVAWLAWFAYEVYCQHGPDEAVTLLVSGGVGGVAGLIIGLKLHFSSQRDYRSIIDQIEDLVQPV